MTDREKVIKGLECCIAVQQYPDELDSGCTFCPYRPDDMGTCPHLDVLLDDALELLKEDEKRIADYRRWHENQKNTIKKLLKAQEPRVMTVEEVVGNIVLERGVMLWFEFNDSIKELSAKDIEYNDYLCDDDMPTLHEPNLKWRDNGYLDGVIVSEYNDVFRCWTSRPTDEQREAVKWG